MKMLADSYPGVQFMVSGVLGPGSNAHGPNEFLHIATGKRVTASFKRCCLCAGKSATPGK